MLIFIYNEWSKRFFGAARCTVNNSKLWILRRTIFSHSQSYEKKEKRIESYYYIRYLRCICTIELWSINKWILWLIDRAYLQRVKHGMLMKIKFVCTFYSNFSYIQAQFIWNIFVVPSYKCRNGWYNHALVCVQNYPLHTDNECHFTYSADCR